MVSGSNQRFGVRSFTDLLAEKDKKWTPQLCVMDWITMINESNFDQFPLLYVDPEKGYFKESASRFANMRLPETFREWVSQLYFIILNSFASISHNALSSDVGTLVYRCKDTAEKMRRGTVTLQYVIATVFVGLPGAEATFFGTNLFWKAVQEPKTNDATYSQLRILLLLAKRVRANYEVFCSKPHLKNMELSVKNMFLSNTDAELSNPGKAELPTIADLFAARIRD